MSYPSSGLSGSDCTVSWQLQNGRSRIQRSVAADGFKGDYPYAGVTVVAENRNPEDDSSASITVETIRDVFAEGVAFGVEDALRDSLLEASEIISNSKLSGCSAAAMAFSGTHVWYALAGNCRIYKIDSDGVKCIVPDQSAAHEAGLSPDHADYHKKTRELKWWLGNPATGKPVSGHARIKKDTTYIILTAGAWIQFEKSATFIYKKGMKRTLEGWLSTLSRELKLAYRRQGGALAAVSGVKNRGVSRIPWKSWTIIALFLGLIGFLVFANPFFRTAESNERTNLFSSDSIEEIVQPIVSDTAALTGDSEGSGIFQMIPDSLLSMQQDSLPSAIPDISADLPLQIVVLGDTALSLNQDTFAVSLNPDPDIQWENFAPGIYAVRGDTASFILADVISKAYPELETVLLDRIITVRENGVAESARWLSSLSPDSAATTGVVVETRSSVAGGAAWIRNYPLFANGNRTDRALEAGGFMGDSLPGLPSLRNPRSYRLVVVL